MARDQREARRRQAQTGARLRNDLTPEQREELMRKEFERLGGEEAWNDALTLDQVLAREQAGRDD